MKITKRQLRRIIKEELATVNDEAIKDTVMSVLSDEGGAAGVDPIKSALEDLENEDISLPDEDIEDIINDVPGVKRHADGDYVDATQLESRRFNNVKERLRKIVRESMEELPPPGADRKPSISTDASILADQIEFAVQEGLEELGATADQADEIIRQLYNRPDMLKEALANGLYDYKRKLDMTGKPKPRSV